MLTEDAIVQALQQVIDPELGCNIVDLGLIYSITIHLGEVTVTMTLTTPGCPMGETIVRGACEAVLRVNGVSDSHVDLVFDPPWHPSMMTDAGRAFTGVRQ